MSNQDSPAHEHGILSAEINALPERVRRFIHDLETRADPAGDVRRAFVAEQSVAALATRVDELERQQGWIRVEDRMPTHIYSVLGWLVISEENAWVDEPHADVVIWNEARGKWQCGSFLNGEDVDVTVTHWMDLPQPPELGTKATSEEFRDAERFRYYHAHGTHIVHPSYFKTLAGWRTQIDEHMREHAPTKSRGAT